MSWLKSLWRKLFQSSPKFMSAEYVKEVLDLYEQPRTMKIQAYDPSQDENRILKGEVESYFE